MNDTPEGRLAAWANSLWANERPPAVEDVRAVLGKYNALREEVGGFFRALIPEVDGLATHLSNLHALITKTFDPPD